MRRKAQMTMLWLARPKNSRLLGMVLESATPSPGWLPVNWLQLPVPPWVRLPLLLQ